MTLSPRIDPKRIAVIAAVAVLAVAAVLLASSLCAPRASAAQSDQLSQALAAEPRASDAALSQAGAVDYFLEIEGLKGESADSRHPGTIQIESWSWGVSNSGSASVGGGGGAGKASFQDFHFTAPTSSASPLLFLASASGKPIKKAVLYARKGGGGKGGDSDYLIITLNDVLVSSYQSSGNAGEPPSDQFSLNFAKIEFSYRPQNKDGSLGAPIKTGWDLKTNEAA
ncbi:MAG: hypothetical protein FJ318_07305 [SAR202 cluster bacterium]|nr:hypothetical protein [SAR202 cluster bacterium]